MNYNTVSIQETPTNLLVQETINGVQIAATGPQGAKGERGIDGRSVFTQTLTFTGELYVVTAKPRYYATFDGTITAIAVSVGTAPVGADIIVNLYINGTTIFDSPSGRPTISDGSYSDLSSTADTATLNTGDYLTVSIDQVGSSFAGSDLTVQIELTQD